MLIYIPQSVTPNQHFHDRGKVTCRYFYKQLSEEKQDKNIRTPKFGNLIFYFSQPSNKELQDWFLLKSK